jgi:AcrR family transcriptional regulator
VAVRRRDQKSRIRREAARLFAKNGYAGTGVEEISRAVGLGRGALYHHIGSKDRLLFDIITLPVLDAVEEAERLVAEPLDAEQKLRRLSRLVMRTIAARLPEWTVFFRDIGALRQPLRAEALAARDAFEGIWAGVIDQGVAEGVFRQMDPIAIKGMLGMHNYSHVWIRPRGRLTPEQIADEFCDVLLAGIRANGSPSGGEPAQTAVQPPSTAMTCPVT